MSGWTDATAQENSYGVPLAPGEVILDVIRVPSVVQVPNVPAIQTEPLEAVPLEIDRVTGLPRNQEGWTGDSDPPAAIACFPKGVCGHLN